MVIQDASERTRWGVVAAYAVVASSNQMLWLTFAPITTVAARHYGVSVSAVGWLSEVFPLLYVLLALPAGMLLDRWFRGALVAGALMTAGGGLLRLVGDDFAVVLAGQLVIAVAQPLVTNAVSKLATLAARPKDRATGIAVGSTGLFAGMLLALALGAPLGGSGDLAPLLWVEGLYAAAGALALAWLLRRPLRDTGELHVAAGLAALRAVWADRVIRSMTGLLVVGFGVFVALTTWLQALLEPAGVSADAAGGLLVAMVLSGAVGSAVLAPVVARRGAERGLLLVSLVVTAGGCALLAGGPALWLDAAALVVMGLFMLATLPVVLELTERRAGSAGGTAAALLWMAGNAGGLVVAVAVQALIDRPGVAFALMAVVALLGLPILAGLGRLHYGVVEQPAD